MKFFVLEEKVCGEWQVACEEGMCVLADTQEEAADILLLYEHDKYRVREYARAEKRIKSPRET